MLDELKDLFSKAGKISSRPPLYYLFIWTIELYKSFVLFCVTLNENTLVIK